MSLFGLLVIGLIILLLFGNRLPSVMRSCADNVAGLRTAADNSSRLQTWPASPAIMAASRLVFRIRVGPDRLDGMRPL